MDKQVAELIKTLNGGLQHLPDLAKEMVHQYVVGHAVVGGLELLFSILTLIAALILIKKYLNRGNPFKNYQALIIRSRSDRDIAREEWSKAINSGHHEDDYEQKTKTAEEKYKHAEKDYQKVFDNRPSEFDPMRGILTGFAAGLSTLSVILFLTGLIDIYRALTPIWSIVRSLTKSM